MPIFLILHFFSVYLFQVTCITDEGSVETPVIKYNAAIGFGNYLKKMFIIVSGSCATIISLKYEAPSP